ncbi:large ribosomal subunit protein mL63-like [Saccoglossus kowalevskii]|uniref:Ribosomal protein 63, mitochondrial-like n=1 Tax=Saccoglossus kowalevskii TaxID=10224 RepID=A0ABM0GVV3_SACKO|nr:PREDICTED: ribosomal protein 63, mitochondrial-like [Saccoglossus kowalevskii]
MWLTVIRMAHRAVRTPIPGRQWSGKHRRPIVMTKWRIRNTVNRLERQAENDRLISKPFLTQEEEYGHALKRKIIARAELHEVRKQTLPEHKRMEDHFEHLNVHKNWGHE